ncbi:CLUMA_CG005635, isoform A [Clunio marinus]|uniref:CLUMA_CG005635, isoform A n=1 Tax=Clunio marinus TaxID=568069 RepID=A0A1J1HVF5_9DIPT|nr:CLUMA_CG005635, isoform A [Clunio marinus]
MHFSIMTAKKTKEFASRKTVKLLLR